MRIGGMLISTPRRIAGHNSGSVNAWPQYFNVQPAGRSLVQPTVKEYTRVARKGISRKIHVSVSTT